eukprot:gene5188-5426_t
MDKAYMESNLPDIVKAGVGATGIMMYINTRSNHCYTGRMGDAMPFVSAAQGKQSLPGPAETLLRPYGSFITVDVAVRPLSSSSSHRTSLAVPDRQHRSGAGSSSRQQGSSRVTSSKEAAAPEELSGPCTLTHAVGLGYGKQKKLQELWLKQQPDAAVLKQKLQHRKLPFISNTCEATRAELGPGDESLVLASETLLQVLSSQEMAMLLHHFHAGHLTQLRDAVAAAAEAARAAAPRLPLVVDLEAFRPAGDGGEGVQLKLPEHCPAAGFTKRDVHGDLGLIVICLDKSGGESGLPSGWGFQRPCSPIKRPAAVYRWHLLRLAVKCRVAYRRSLRRRWWQLVEDADAAAAERARQAEVQAWKVMGAAVKVNLKGDMFAKKPTAARHLRVTPPPTLSFPGAAAEGCEEDVEEDISDIDSPKLPDSPFKAAAAAAVGHAGFLYKAKGAPTAAGSPTSRATPASLSLRPARAGSHHYEGPAEAAVSNSPTWKAAKAKAWAAYPASNTVDAAALSLRSAGARGNNVASGRDNRQGQWPEYYCSNSPSGSNRSSPTRLHAKEPASSPTRLQCQKISLRKSSVGGGY